MKSFAKNAFYLFSLGLILSCCASREKIVYVQDIEKAASYESTEKYEPVMQPDDLLSIVVSSDNPEVVAPFNLPDITGVDGEYIRLKTYLIDSYGYIDFPVLGKVKLGGLSRSNANAKLVSAISEYIKNPTVNLRILNYKVSVLGEVAKPGALEIKGERVTLLEAISAAGDLTIYGKRDNILVIRDSEGKKTYTRVNILSADFLNSPFYYLKQNDVVFIEANQTRLNSSRIGPDVGVYFSIISLAITISVLLLRN